MTNEAIKNAIRLIQMEIRANALLDRETPKVRRYLSDAVMNLKIYMARKDGGK